LEIVELLAAYMIRPRGLTASSLVLAKGAGRGNLSWKLIVDQYEMIEKYTFVMSFPPNLSIT
jgi:hypothetical protein